MPIKINLGAWGSVFAVPSKVVDEGLKFADGAKLRVLLYILRNNGNQFDEKAVSKGTGVSVTDIPEILDYWVSLDILAKSDNTYIPSQTDVQIKNNYDEELQQSTAAEKDLQATDENFTANSTVKSEAYQNESAGKTTKQHFAIGKPQKPDFVFTSQRLSVDKELQFLVDEVQTTFGKVLANSDISTLLMLKDTCGLPLDVILMLVQYCKSIDKANMRTVEKIGVRWSDEGIYSLEAADNKIKQIIQTSRNFSVVSSTFGLKNVGSPTKKQLEYGDKWIGEWKFSREMLREAYERCVDTKGDMNFRYIDGILKRWNSNGIYNIDALMKFEKSNVKPQKKQSSSYDIDELEKIDMLDNI